MSKNISTKLGLALVVNRMIQTTQTQLFVRRYEFTIIRCRTFFK